MYTAALGTLTVNMWSANYLSGKAITTQFEHQRFKVLSVCVCRLCVCLCLRFYICGNTMCAFVGILICHRYSV